jgi:hypothetical protein
MVTGVTSDQTDDAVQANIVAVGYKFLPALHCVAGHSACYEDSVRSRILGDVVMASKVMTHELCMEACFSRQQRLAGVENGKQCMCGDSLSSEAVPSANCTVTCPGNSSQRCGGWMAINVMNVTCGF